jgi:hypothetical protein
MDTEERLSEAALERELERRTEKMREAQLDVELARRNELIRERMIIDPEFRRVLHARHEKVLAERQEDGEWIAAWRKLLAGSKKVRDEGKKAIIKLHDQEREDGSPKQRKGAIKSDDDEDEEGDFGCASDF